MTVNGEPTELLFSYGTLQTEAVQLATFGRRLEGRPDSLVGYSLEVIQIEDREFASKSGAHQRNAQFTGDALDSVEGIVFTVTKKELELADKYEPDDYKRVLTQMKSGASAWVYLCTRQ